jgi:hypothetical protein
MAGITDLQGSVRSCHLTENRQSSSRIAESISLRRLTGEGLSDLLSRAESKEMNTDYPGKGVNMLQRAVMQHLSSTEWRLAKRLPVPAGDMMLGRLVLQGWIDMRGEDHLVEVKLTEAGLQKLRSRI